MYTNDLTRRVPLLTLTAVAVVMTVSVARAALSPEAQCQKSRYDAAAKYAQCQNKALGKHFAVNDLALLNPVLSKCREKYKAVWLKLQKKAVGTGSTCDSPRFVDNGAWVTDNLTGLDWEEKTDDGSLHDKDDTWDWLSAYTFFLSGASSTLGLNEPNAVFACFAGSCDWRLPTVAELQTILSEPYPCTTSPCIDAVFGPTAVADYWSSTTLADNLTYAWGVYSATGEVSYGVKTLDNSVRAVRGGL